MNIEKALKNAKAILENGGSKSPCLDSEILMSKTLESKREYILLNLKKNLENPLQPSHTRKRYTRGTQISPRH